MRDQIVVVAERSNARAKKGRLISIFGASLLLTLLASVAFWMRQLEIERLAGEIELAGGDVVLQTPVLERLKRWIQGGDSQGTFVILRGTQFDDGWIRSHSHLRPLSVVNLILEDATALSDSCLAELIDQHDLKTFTVRGANANDEAAAALGRKSRLTIALIQRTQLTDSGLSLLTLENIEQLQLTYTEVTASGLEALTRCEQLENINLDGRQLSDESIEILRGLPQLKHLGIQGSDVTDDVARALHSMKGLQSLWLYDHSITETEYQSLKQALPGTNMGVWEPRKSTEGTP